MNFAVFVVLTWLCEAHIVSSIPNFRFSMNSFQNETGDWLGQVQLDHDGANSWDIDVNHTTAESKNSELITIVAKILVPSASKQKGLELKSCPTVPPKPPPPPGYELLPGFGYYSVHMDKESWLLSQRHCLQDKTHLLVINSDEEALAIGKLLVKKGLRYHDYWIGFHDQYVEGKYVTIFNDTLESAGFSKWYPIEPDGGTSYNCGFYAYYMTSRYGLGDENCGVKFPFICELEIL